MRHVLIVGNPKLFLEFLDFFKDEYSCIVHEAAYKALSPLVVKAFKRIISLPISTVGIDLGFYENNYSVIEEAASEIWNIRPFNTVFGNDEHILLVSSRLRKTLGIDGNKTDFVKYFRNKILMKSKLIGSGIQYPNYLEVFPNNLGQAKTFFDNCKCQVVVKPISQAASQGVLISGDWDKVSSYISRYTGSLNLEEYIEGDSYQIDGVVLDGEINFLSCSQFLHPPVKWETDNTPLGCVMIDDERKKEKVLEFSKKVVDLFCLENSVFHLEAFLRDGEFVFLEIASRPGGAGTVKAIDHSFGVNLIKVNTQLELGNVVDLQSGGLIDNHKEVGGYLLLPAPTRSKFRIKGYKINIENCVNIVDSQFLHIGYEMNKTPVSYESPAVFIFKGDSYEKLKTEMKEVIDSVEVIY